VSFFSKLFPLPRAPLDEKNPSLKKERTSPKKLLLLLLLLTISLHGSNSEYLADLENTFCAAPTKTAAIKGVRPYLASMGEKASPPRTSAKNATPVASRTVGVMIAAPPHPNLRKMKREAIIIMKVTAPVEEEKSPMKAE